MLPMTWVSGLSKVQLAGEPTLHGLEHQPGGPRGAGRGRHDVDGGGPGAAQVLVGAVDQHLVARVRVDGGHQAPLDPEVDPEVAPRQLLRVAHREHLEGVAPDLDAVVGHLDVVVEPPEHRVVLEQVGHRVDRAEVVDRHEVDVGADLGGRPEEVAADAAEAVDPHTDGHLGWTSFVFTVVASSGSTLEGATYFGDVATICSPVGRYGTRSARTLASLAPSCAKPWGRATSA